ncbi:MAG: DUF1343 domain-containing protein [Tannerella sp.]|jgi:uncharacterized protein YbbC (DUF1343 family)|nr:DUF1343 domain-containing protein [Tannerella sp.]
MPTDGVIVGAERMELLLPEIDGKRVGLAVNHTSMLVQTRTHLLDTLLAQGVKVKRIFVPEHGFRGEEDAGARVKNHLDMPTGIPVISLYGKHFKPTAEQLAGLDVIVFDMQDVGARFYTYISTMHYLMEACAEQGIAFVVLDRPNPNDYVDGPVRKPGYRSFVGIHPVPILHGLTVGELAMMINGEGWLRDGRCCPLTVIRMERWRHGDPYRLPVKPSPNLPNEQAIRLYPSLCLFEGTGVSVGRGTHFPFQALGYPDPEAGDFTYTPVSIAGLDSDPMYRERMCYGVDLRDYPFRGGLTLQFLLDFYSRLGKNGKRFFTRAHWFDLLAGTRELRMQILSGDTEKDIRATWQADLERYRVMRRKYLLYPDYETANISR